MRIKVFLAVMMLVLEAAPIMGAHLPTSQSITKEQTQNTVSVKGKGLVPFKETMAKLGMTDFVWKTSKEEGLKGTVTVSSNVYFKKQQLDRLISGLKIKNPEWPVEIPQAVEPLLVEEKNLEVENSIPDQKERVEMTINDDKYQIIYTIYQYKIINGSLYVPYTMFKELGLGEVVLKKNNAVVIPVSYKAVQSKIDKIEKALLSKDSKDVLNLWVKAQKNRSGALQYALLDDSLRERVMPQIKERGWITGGSSPSLDGGQVTILKEEKISDTAQYTVQYESMLQDQVDEVVEQVITMKKTKEGYWKITKVEGNMGYYTYSNLN